MRGGTEYAKRVRKMYKKVRESVGPPPEAKPTNPLEQLVLALLSWEASATEAAKLNAYVAEGGALLVLGESALDGDKTKFLLDLGASYLGPAEYDVDYTVLGDELGQGRVSSPFLNYEAALRVQKQDGTEVLATIREPYFSRTYAQYCSHRNTPYRLGTATHPAVLQKGKVLFIPHRLGQLYYELGARLHRNLFSAALNRVYTKPVLECAMPSAGRVSLLYQPEQKRYVAHLLYGPPLQRGQRAGSPPSTKCSFTATPCALKYRTWPQTISPSRST